MQSNVPFGTTAFTSRRRFLTTAGASLAAYSLPLGRTLGQAPAKYLRVNLADTAAAAPHLASYAKAIGIMLKKDPSDPLNWYRLAFTHFLDCPHHNWWFLPWHRGYTGWLEQIIRKVSGDDNFALPYWDWTPKAGQAIPAAFLPVKTSAGAPNLLNPAADGYIPDLDTFKNTFHDPMQKFYAGLTSDQLNQLKARQARVGQKILTYDKFENFWTLTTGPGGPFYALKASRAPDFSGLDVDVNLDAIHSDLAPTKFEVFGSYPVSQHSKSGRSAGALETGAHDNVHNDVHGFMEDFFSPVDPLFGMHHSNLDRLWDVWTRKQQQAKQPILPTVKLTTWQKEKFVFYVGADGQPVAKTSAGDYAAIGDFNYSYTAASGSDVAPPVKPSEFQHQLWAASGLESTGLESAPKNKAEVMLPDALHQSAGGAAGPEMVAMVGLVLPPNAAGKKFRVFVNPPKDGPVTTEHPGFAGNISIFGSHGSGHGEERTFSVPITSALKRLKAAQLMNSDEPLRIQVVPVPKGGEESAPIPANVSSVNIGVL